VKVVADKAAVAVMAEMAAAAAVMAAVAAAMAAAAAVMAAVAAAMAAVAAVMAAVAEVKLRYSPVLQTILCMIPYSHPYCKRISSNNKLCLTILKPDMKALVHSGLDK
jgi:hypothetical protein